LKFVHNAKLQIYHLIFRVFQNDRVFITLVLNI